MKELPRQNRPLHRGTAGHDEWKNYDTHCKIWQKIGYLKKLQKYDYVKKTETRTIKNIWTYIFKCTNYSGYHEQYYRTPSKIGKNRNIAQKVQKMWICEENRQMWLTRKNGTDGAGCYRQVLQGMSHARCLAATTSTNEHERLVLPSSQHAAVRPLRHRVDVRRHVLRLATAEHLHHLVAR